MSKSVLTRTVMYNWQHYLKDSLVDNTDKNYQWLLDIWAIETDEQISIKNSNVPNTVLRSVWYEWMLYSKGMNVNPGEDHYEDLVKLWVIESPKFEVPVEVPTETEKDILEWIDTTEWEKFPEIQWVMSKKEFKEYCEINWFPTTWEDFKKLRKDYRDNNQNVENVEPEIETINE
jgi:hypothetical protein